MVNTGRPSPACKACRARRLKCDQTKPACNKCTRAKRVCPGYREPFEINFKDQTDLIIRKHERSNSISKEVAPRRYSKGHKRSGSSSSDSSSDLSDASGLDRCRGREPSVWLASPNHLLRLDTPVMQQASSYFMTHYINIKTHLPGAGLQFLLPLIQDAESSETFRSAFEAVSMASIASRPNSGAIVPLARVYYNKALRQIALTVQDKSKAKEDQALASIIMMIIYEVLMWDDAKNSLTFHVQGAQAMIRLRDPPMRDSWMGKAMLEFIRGFIIHQYAHSTDLTDDFENMLWWAMEGGSDTDPKHNLRKLNVETTVLKKQVAEFLTHEPDKTGMPTAIRIYKSAKQLEGQLKKFIDNTPDQIMRTIERWQDEIPESEIHRAEAYPGKVYSFANIFVGAKFLSIHLHRLILAEIMVRMATWIETHGGFLSTASALRQEAMGMAEEQILEIIAIIPFYCKWPNYDSPSPFGGMTCSFPLFVAGSSSVISKKQKTFLIGRLSYLSSVTGLKLAAKFAQLLLQTMRTESDTLADTTNVTWDRNTLLAAA